MNLSWENDKKPNFRPNFGLSDPNLTPPRRQKKKKEFMEFSSTSS